MQRRGGKKRFDNHDIEKQAAGTFVEKFPFLESMVIKIIYYQKGDNPILMSRTLHVYPEDFAYFHIPCLIHDCLEGTFELAPIVMNILKESKSRSEGRLACKGSLSKDLPSDHGYIEYTIDVTYKTGGVKPDTSEKQKEKVKIIEKKPKKEALEKNKGIKPPVTTKGEVKGNQKTLPNKPVKKTEVAVSKVKVKTDVAKKLVKKHVNKTITTAKSKTVASKSKVVKTSKSPAKKEAVKTKKLEKPKTSINVKKTSSKTKKKKTGSR